MIERSLALLALLTGCYDSITPVKSSETNNETAQVAELFTHDGCTIYRFADVGWYHYYVRCRAEEKAQTETDIDIVQPKGANIHNHETIQTVCP